MFIICSGSNNEPSRIATSRKVHSERVKFNRDLDERLEAPQLKPVDLATRTRLTLRRVIEDQVPSTFYTKFSFCRVFFNSPPFKTFSFSFQNVLSFFKKKHKTFEVALFTQRKWKIKPMQITEMPTEF